MEPLALAEGMKALEEEQMLWRPGVQVQFVAIFVEAMHTGTIVCNITYIFVDAREYICCNWIGIFEIFRTVCSLMQYLVDYSWNIFRSCAHIPYHCSHLNLMQIMFRLWR